MTWSAAQVLSLAVGAALVDVIGIRPVYWMGGSFWPVAGSRIPAEAAAPDTREYHQGCRDQSDDRAAGIEHGGLPLRTRELVSA
jgi:hypothetical protein